MPSRTAPSRFPAGTPGFEAARPLTRDVAWDRPIFRAPVLPNPRVIFDPLPFRTQLFTAARQICRMGRNPDTGSSR
ncbi:MAG: hypothetical protein JNG83_14965 [Opitutaceae bacterium]|nr:hypothetical protein [Opitutaceae bacterium]